MQYTTLFIQESLISVDITFNASSPIAFLDAIAAGAPRLQAPIIKAKNRDPTTPEKSSALTRVICSQHVLERCWVSTPLSSDSLSHLAWLSTLTDLRFKLDNADYRTMLSPSSSWDFATLRTLHIASSKEHIEPLLSFLCSIHAPQLQEFTFFPHEFHDEDQGDALPPDSAFLQKLFDALTGFDSLQQVGVDCRPHKRYHPTAATSQGPSEAGSL